MISEQWHTLPKLSIALIALTVVAQPFGVSFELFTLIMALVGVHDLVRDHQGCRQNPAVRFYTILFACFWLPGLMALPDAVNFKVSLVDTFGQLRFYFAGVFITNRIVSTKLVKAVSVAITAIVLFWCVDAWIQSLFGYDVLGIPLVDPARVSGVFGDDPVLGWMLVLYAGITVAVIAESKSVWLAVGVALLLVTVIMISGVRAAWVSIVWLVAAAVIMLWCWRIRLPRKWLLVFGIGAVLSVGALTQHPSVKERLALAEEASAMSYEAWDFATSFRLTLWNTAFAMIEDNLINGVGIKGFRYAYPAYDQEGDVFIHLDKQGRELGAYHAHQIVLEALAETGIIGLAGLLMAFWLVFVKLFQRIAATKAILPLGYWLGLVGVMFPINTHLSLFSSYWAQAFWFMAALTVAATFTACKDSSSPVGAS